MTRFLTFVGRHGLDVLAAVSAAEAVVASAVAGDADGAPQTATWFSVVASVAVALPLALRHQAPFTAPALVWPLAAAVSFVDGRVVTDPVGTYVVGMVAALLLGNLRSTVLARRGLVIMLVSTVVVALNDPKSDVGELVFTPLLFVLLWVAGYAIRERIVEAEEARGRALAAEHERDVGARRAILEERARIAREMHDVVGHGVSVMTVQAAAVRRLLTPGQDRERAALLSVEETGREALAEMRRLVTVLRDPDDDVALSPPPRLTQLPKLLEQTRSSGLPVDLSVEGEPLHLPAGIDLAAYRVVQEALTNTIRHAHARQARVCLRYRADCLEIEVVDDGRGAGNGGRDGNGGNEGNAGHGLVGMRERVATYGGSLEAGPRPSGGFRVHALLPVTP